MAPNLMPKSIRNLKNIGNCHVKIDAEFGCQKNRHRSKASLFQPKVHQHFKLFSTPLPRFHFSDFWCSQMPKCLILAPPWHLAVPKRTAEITQVSPKMPGELLLADLLSRSLSDSSWSPMWLVLDAFGMDFGWILDGFLDGFWMDSDTIV